MSGGTLVGFFDRLVERPRADLLRYKAEGAYRDIPTEDFARRVRSLSMVLMEMGVEPGDRVVLLSENRPEWPIADFAIQNASAANVPVYSTLNPRQISYILKDSGARVALVSTEEQLQKLREAKGAGPPDHLIVFDRAGSLREGEVSLEEAYRRGEAAFERDPGSFDTRRSSVSPDSLASVIYTSGTTGDPKGVMLTHSNFVSNVESVLRLVPMHPTDSALSFLPLSHVLERMVEYCYFRSGMSIAFAESVDTVAQNLGEVRPTMTVAVPRVFEKVQARILETVRSGPPVKRRLFFWALRQGRRRLEYTLRGEALPALLKVRCLIAQRLVFSKLQARLGGRLKFFISGGAPLPREVAEFFFSAGFTILEGYGLTETSPVIAVNLLGRLRLGTVGPIIPGVEVRIAEDGEILVRGPNVMKGYWQNPQATAEALAGGWFHTGDIGHLDADGFLVITDRKKDLIVTSGGKNIAPQPIENALKASPYIVNAVCLGDRERFIAALLVPDFEALRGWAKEKGVTADEPMRALLERPEVRELFNREVETAMASFPQFEKVKEFALLERDFSLDEGEITPTLKVKRRVIRKKYAELIEGLYR